ncbi:unnamed protein product [Musa hybrid cultivar]
MDRREAAGPKSRDPHPPSPPSPRAIPEAFGNTLPYDLCSEMGGARGRGWCWCSTWRHMHSPLLPHSHHQRSVSPPMCSMERAKTPRPPLMPPHESNQMPFAQSKPPVSSPPPPPLKAESPHRIWRDGSASSG